MIRSVKRKLESLMKQHNEKVEKKRISNSKLGVTYSLFSGEELLEDSIKRIRDNVDYINVVFQTFSWYGDPAQTYQQETLNLLVQMGYIDKLIHYEFSDFGNNEKLHKYKIDKVNIGLDDLRKNGCTHCMIMDVDELYKVDEFKTAKEFVISKGLTHSACNIYDYYHSPSIRKQDASKYAVPFIFSFNRNRKVTGKSNIPCKVDLLRTFPYNKLIHKFYYLNDVSMHHMTGIRNDYELKLKASISNASQNGHNHVMASKESFNSQSRMSKDELIGYEDNDGTVYIETADFKLFEDRG